MDLDYVLPLRWSDDAGLAELTGYLRRLARHAHVIVVDGSAEELYDRHARRWHGLVTHVRPDSGLRFANGKVVGVTTGLRLARADRVVIDRSPAHLTSFVTLATVRMHTRLMGRHEPTPVGSIIGFGR